jgi:hypothetical protein
MKALLAALLLAAGTTASAADPPSKTDAASIDAAMDFAHVYGIVRYFHPSDSLDRIDWNRFIVRGAQRMEAVADRGAIGSALESLFAAPVADFKVVPKGAPAPEIKGEGPLVEWRHLGYGMEPSPRGEPYVSWRTHHKPLFDGGVKPGFFQHEGMAEQVKEDEPVLRIAVTGDREALVPVSMPMSATKVGEAQDAKLKELSEALKAVDVGSGEVTRAQSWANGIAAWNVARHFYPYWQVVPLDWDGVLRKWLAAQPERQSRAALADQLRRLIAPLDDGHGRIVDLQDKQPKLRLPIAVRPLGDRWVVEASLVPERVRPGDVIASVDGKPAARHFAGLMALQSGSPQYVRWRAAVQFAIGPRDSSVTLGLERAGRKLTETLRYDREKATIAARPQPFSEIAPGIFYVDFFRFDKAALAAAHDKLAAAKGIVFDVRGYMSPESAEMVKYWLTGPDSAQWMIVPRFDRPFGRFDTGWSFGWQVERDASLEKPKKVLLMDGRSLSYAESIIGYFAGQRTGRILGERSGGANGNVDLATLPSGLVYGFTGMKVTRHDGSVFHREGFAPDVVVAPTIAGLAEGRDELIERAAAELAAP